MGEVEFRRNKDTGMLETYRDGQYIGMVITMGDQVISIVPRVPWFCEMSSKAKVTKKMC